MVQQGRARKISFGENLGLWIDMDFAHCRGQGVTCRVQIPEITQERAVPPRSLGLAEIGGSEGSGLKESDACSGRQRSCPADGAGCYCGTSAGSVSGVQTGFPGHGQHGTALRSRENEIERLEILYRPDGAAVVVPDIQRVAGEGVPVGRAHSR